MELLAYIGLVREAFDLIRGYEVISPDPCDPQTNLKDSVEISATPDKRHIGALDVHRQTHFQGHWCQSSGNLLLDCRPCVIST